MNKDVYKWWSRQKLKDEILKLKLAYNELFDAKLKTQEENKELKKACNICDEANIDLKEKIVGVYGGQCNQPSAGVAEMVYARVLVYRQ